MRVLIILKSATGPAYQRVDLSDEGIVWKTAQTTTGHGISGVSSIGKGKDSGQEVYVRLEELIAVVPEADEA